MTGGTPKTTISEYYEDGTVPWIVSGDIHKGEIFDCDKKITELAVENSNARYLPKDSVLIALNGQGKTRGTVALLRASNATCNQSIVSINPNNQRELFSDYLFYFLKSQYRQIRNITGDKDRAGLNMPLIRSITIPLPPLEEQKRIAAILDKADAIRRKRQQAIQLADDFLRSVFLDMFGDPVTNPKGWEVKKLDEVGVLDRGKSKHRPRNDPKLLGGEHPLIQTGDVAKSGGYITSYSATYSDFGLAQSRKWKAGTLCITIAANIAKTGILTFEACFPDSVVGFKPNQLVTTEYVQTWLSFLQKILEANAPESAQKNINLAILRDLDIPLPPIEQQIRFTNTVEKINELKRKLNNSSKLNKDGFNSLSQKAFAGEL
ncbi:type I restriction enzyme, S subunit [Pseudoalteromonas nigrifaciens]|uniref:Type I restriction enzyme, S subunit n=1 Tax=Pseudoalteromonas nigrifaciens TaxID=28109 RepID=A0AAC9UGZ2_9GAMM|nr:type I restriction enzyme, S subunit [Pseudoalteromonas nigrifaciens]